MKRLRYTNMSLSVQGMRKHDAPRDWFGSNIKKNNEFLFCLEGECILTVDNQNYIITPNTLMLFPEGHSYKTRLTASRQFSYYQCHFHAELDGVPVFKALNLDDGELAVNIPDPDAMLTLFEGGVRDNSYEDIDAILLNRSACAAKIIAEYVKLRRQTIPGKEADDFSDVIEYMQKNLSSPPSVPMLASLMHLEPSYFIRRFSSVFGLPPMQYFDKLRLQRALLLLENTNMEIEEVSREIGIENKYYFNRFFTKHAHISPKVYRDVLNDNLL